MSKNQKYHNLTVSGPIGPRKGKNKHNGKGQFFRNIGLKIGQIRIFFNFRHSNLVLR